MQLKPSLIFLKKFLCIILFGFFVYKICFCFMAPMLVPCPVFGFDNLVFNIAGTESCSWHEGPKD
jgi:hypothetical protein